MKRPRSPLLIRLGVALVLFGVATVTRAALDPVWGDAYPFTTFYPAIAIAAWLGGALPGLIVTALGALAATWWWLAPAGSLGVTVLADQVALAVFVGVGALVSVLAEALHRASEGAEAKELASVRLAAIVESSADAIIAKAMDGTITSWNPAAERIFGYTAAEAIGQPIAMIVPADRVDDEEQVMARLRRGQPVDHYETVRLRRDGTRIDVSLTMSPIRNTAGDVIGASTIARDISERKVAERERVRLLAREQAARAEAERAQRQTAFLAEASNLLAASLDYETTLRSVARVAVPFLADWCAVDLLARDGTIQRLALAHLDPEKEKFGRDWFERRPIRPDARWGVPRVIRTAEPEVHATFPEGWIDRIARDPDEHATLRGLGLRSMMIVPMITWHGTAGAMTFVSAESGREYGPGDVTLASDLARRAALALENARLYQDAEEMRTAAEATNRAKDEFLAVLSHELRTPLTAILGWVNILRTRRLDDAASARALETVERNTRLQARLINDLLDVSRIIAGKLKLEPTPTDVAVILEDAVAAIQRDADAKGVSVTLSRPAAAATVLGEPVRLQQIVTNLLSNALKFTPSGGRVDVRLELSAGSVRLVVRDTGIGITPEILPRIFDRFRQADSSATRRHGGLGLGLAIVRHLSELHGGSVHPESAGRGRGATFTVELPLLLTAERGRRGATVEDRGGGDARDTAPRELHGLRVLVVEDDTDTRELISGVLAQCGAEVTGAADVPDALRRLDTSRFDLLLSDLGMPGQDGYDLIRQVRSMERAAGRTAMPAIALTAYAGADDRSRAFDAGFHMHVIKPIAPDDLVDVVAAAAGRSDG